MDLVLTLSAMLATFAGLAAAAVALLQRSCPERRDRALSIAILCASILLASAVGSQVRRPDGPPRPPPMPMPDATSRPTHPPTSSESPVEVAPPNVAPQPVVAPAPQPSQGPQPCQIAETCERLVDSLAGANRHPPAPPTASWTPFLIGAALLVAVLLMNGRHDPWIKWTKRAAAVIGVLTPMVTFATGGVKLLAAYRSLSPAPTKLVSLVAVPERRASRPVAFAVNVTWPIVVGGDDKESLAFVVPFAEAGCRGRAKVSDWPGARPNAAFVTFLSELGAALAKCARPDRPVRVTVRGFASSSEFQDPGSCDERVGHLNLALANERARSVAAALTRCGDACRGLEVSLAEWSSYEEMRRQARFNDRLLRGVYDPKLGVLTRRAEILVGDAADCALAVETVDVADLAEPTT